MLRDLYKYMCVSLAALLAAACADLPETTEVPDPQEPRYMTFDISEIDTKVSDSEDLKSYEFSIWIFDPDAKVTLVNGDDVKLRYDSTSGRWRFHDGISFIDVPWRDRNHDFFVISSYDLAGTSEKISFDKSSMGYMKNYQNSVARFSIPTMNMTYSSGGSDYNYYKDILYAAASRDVRTEDGYKPVSLTLRHLWPALEFNMINETNQKKYITDFSVSNFDVAFDGFSFYVNRGYDSQLNNYTGVAANKYEVADFVLDPDEELSVFGMPVMVFPQKFVSNENSAILSFSVDGVKTTKPFYVDAPAGLSTQAWNPGTLYSYDIRLTTAAEPLVISPTASVKHVKDANGVLTHSALTLNLPLEDAQLSRVKNLRVVVSKGGVDYLDQTFATVSSNQITLYKGSASDPGLFYMPKGAGYQVTLTYNDGFYDRTETCEATSPAPDYTLTVNVSATSNQFTVNSMSVNIADRVLDECPLSGNPSNSMLLRVTGKDPSYNFIYTYTSGVSLRSSTFLSNVTFSSWAPQDYGYYTIYPYVKFDDVVKEAANCNIVTSNNYSGQQIYPKEVRYRTVSQIYDSRNLEDGEMYVIRANWNSSIYWSVNTSTEQLVSGSSQTSFPKEYVFVYDRDESKEVAGGFKDTNPSNYRLESVGAWKSLATGDYMAYSGGLFYFNVSSASSAQYVVCANGWDTYNTSADIDMCVDATRMIVYTNSAFTLGTSSSAYVNYNQQWKWNIFKVQAE
ncbi:MAG: hypothetical protein IJ940_09140 [Bacteroidales bacterium]|nr:hypothetical protein [Bacteroidales bacterium]